MTASVIDADGRAPVSIAPSISPPEKVLAGYTTFTPAADIWGVGALASHETAEHSAMSR
jgi:hypothetical protein